MFPVDLLPFLVVFFSYQMWLGIKHCVFISKKQKQVKVIPVQRKPTIIFTVRTVREPFVVLGVCLQRALGCWGSLGAPLLCDRIALRRQHNSSHLCKQLKSSPAQLLPSRSLNPGAYSREPCDRTQ